MQAQRGIRVLVSDAIDSNGIEVMRRNGLHVDYRPEIKHDELLTAIREYNVLVVRSRTKVRKDVIDAGENLRIIARVGVGLDNIDVDYARSKGIRVVNAEEAAMTAVAELVIGLMVCLARGIARADAAMKEGRWLKSELMGIELKGKYLGIVGMGKIGTRVARLARALGMNIIAYDVVKIDPMLVRELGMVVTDIDTLLRSSDFVTLHVPLNDGTRHMISAERLARMKPSAYIINTARGAVVDEQALLDALKGGRIAGAALDVYEVEPPTNLELIRLPNVVCTPHIGAQTREAQALASAIIAEKVVQLTRELYMQC
ncbi:MAG: D-2-hydroxyacid dehydrogenase [Candidatus Nitrosocaldus sp.]|nr:D-2-hydroxyacid dehydrogenase [Candidatus Nitrosocaldus sp.]MDW8000359.1 D-2-hydroxyacid dehydrogenase [Candidatus Nitrosocaldus sp.]